MGTYTVAAPGALMRTLTAWSLALALLLAGASARAQDATGGIAPDTPWNLTGVNDALARALVILGAPQAEWPHAGQGRGAPDRRLATQYAQQWAAGDLPLQRTALEALGAAGSPEEAYRLLTVLESPNTELHEAAMRALQATPPGILLPALLTAFSNTGALSPSLGAVLSPLRSPLLEKHLLERLERLANDVHERAAAARVLGVLRSIPAIPALHRAVEAGIQPLAQAALDGLFVMRATEATGVWTALLEHPDEQVATTAVRALGDLGGVAAQEALFAVAVSNQAAPAMHSAALLAMAQWPYMEAVPALVNVLEQNPNLRGPVSRTLREKTGVDLGVDPALWRRWMVEGLPEEGGTPPGEVPPAPVDPSQDALPFQVQFVP